MPTEGLPQLTEIWFWSGDRVFLLRDEPIMRHTIQYKRLYLILTEQVLWRYGIIEDRLNYELSEYGVYIKEYPACHFVRLSGNPEAPVVLMTCNFDGTDNYGYEIVDKDNRIKRLETLSSDLTSENMRLAEQLKVAHQRLRVLAGEKA